ncbi:MAG: hypothetical protein ACTSRA_16745 [Promethearchaeota archaeon]
MSRMIPDFEHEMDAKDSLINEMKAWLQDAMHRHVGTPCIGIHDECTFLTSWREYQMLSGDDDVERFALERLNAYNTWARENLMDGYYKNQEVHHGTEHHVIFLAWLKEMKPDNEIINLHLKNAANHIVEKRKKPKMWYDFDSNRFASAYLGTRHIGSDGLNIPEHLRMVRLAWLGLASGGNPALKDFIINYSEEWAENIVENDEIPLWLNNQENNNKGDFKKKYMKALRVFLGAAPKRINAASRRETHVANGSPMLFLTLFDQTKKRIFLNAAEKIIIGLLDQLWSTYAHPIGELAWQLHQRNNIKKLRAHLMPCVENALDLSNHWLSLKNNVRWNAKTNSRFKFTVGMRKDMPMLVIKEKPNGKVKSIPSPSTFILAYKLTKNKIYLLNAIKIACSVLKEARKMYPDGRKHGCGAKTIAAMCIGHGRNWGAGYVSTTLRGCLKKDDAGITLPALEL